MISLFVNQRQNIPHSRIDQILSYRRYRAETYIEALGERWADNNFNLGYLLETFSKHSSFCVYRGNLVKSPIHFYIGLCQDLNLDVVPFDSRLLRSMRVMGQDFYNPPNVRLALRRILDKLYYYKRT